MPYKLTLKQKNAGRGAELQIVGLGTFKNGSSYMVSDEDAENFRTVQRDLGNDQTLVQAFKHSDYVVVEEVDVAEGREVKSRTAAPPRRDVPVDPGPQVNVGRTEIPGQNDKQEGDS
jgi:hypothetical protein